MRAEYAFSFTFFVLRMLPLGFDSRRLAYPGIRLSHNLVSQRPP